MKEQNTPLILTPNIDDPDSFYAELIALQDGLDDEAAQACISQLLLILANHIGDLSILREAFSVVKNRNLQ